MRGLSRLTFNNMVKISYQSIVLPKQRIILICLSWAKVNLKRIMFYATFSTNRKIAMKISQKYIYR